MTAPASPYSWQHPSAPPPLDPQIVEFMRLMGAEGARYPKRHTIPIAEGRANAEKVRAPWTQGGPVMARTEEHAVPTRHGAVRIRMHVPQNRVMPGALVYIHGGGFVLFSLDTHDRVMREYAGRAGMVVIGIDYTRAPEARFPQPHDECVDVMRWLARPRNAQALNIDPAQLFIGGDSAGANLSVGACLVLRDAGDALPRGMLLNYGAYSTELYRESVVRYGAGEYGLSLHMMLWFYGLYARGPEDFADPRLHSLTARLQGLPATCMVVTECDPLYDDNRLMAARLREAGVAVNETLYPGTIHGFLEAVSVADVAGRAFDDSVRWLHALAAR